MNDPIKLAIVDDEMLFLEGLSLLLSDEGKWRIVLKANGGQMLLDKLANLPLSDFPDILLLDIQMKPMDGFQVINTLKKHYSELKIIVVSSHYRSEIFGHMIKLGASGFLPKDCNYEDLEVAIDSVYKTGAFFSPDDYKMLASFVKKKSTTKYFNSLDKLSSREVEVLKLICSEFTNQEIANKLYLSKRTIENHRQRILDKIGAKNTAGLVVYALSHDVYIPPNFNYHN